MGSVLSLTLVSDQYRDDETVDSDDTSHDDWNDRLHDEVWSHHTHGCNTNTTLGSTIGSTQSYVEGRGGRGVRERGRARKRKEQYDARTV